MCKSLNLMSLFALWFLFIFFLFFEEETFIDQKAIYKKLDKEFLVAAYILFMAVLLIEWF